MAGTSASIGKMACSVPIILSQYTGANMVMPTAPAIPKQRNRGPATVFTWRTSFQRPSEAFSLTSLDTATGNPAVARLNTGP